MGFLDTIISTTVFRMKADASQAIAEAKKLSGEQKKAALAQGKALEEEGKAAEGLASKYAKGAAVIVATYAILKASVDAYDKRQTLAAASATVDLNRLNEAAGGVKTTMNLLTVAAAGATGAWKLNTEQLIVVAEGMRALEKRGHDATEVQNALTEAITKGKVDGLDKFGLSLKSTGDRTKDLKNLMHALRGEVRLLGGDLEKTGDDLRRQSTNIQNAVDTLKAVIGKEAERELGIARRLGRGYAGFLSGDGIDAFASDGTDFLERVNAYSTAQKRAANEAERNKLIADRQAYAAAYTKRRMAEYDRLAELAKERAAKAKSSSKIARDAAKEEAESLLALAGLALGDRGDSRLTFDQEQNRAARERALQDRIADAEAKGAADEERVRFEKAKALRQSKLEAETRKAGEKQNYLDSVFGPVEQFDAYAEGFRTLTDAVKASGDAILDSVIKGEKLTKASAGRAVAAVLGAESHKLWGLGLSTELQGWATLNPAMIAAGIAEMGGAFALGRIAASFGGSGASGSARGGANSRPSGFSQSPTQSTGASLTIVYGDSNNRDSPRFRAMETRRAVQMAGQIAPPQGVRNG